MQNRNTSLARFIAGLPVVRGLSDGGPGCGNQAATLNILQWLREQGFNGTFELIYPPEDREKMIQLLDLPADIGVVHHDATKKLRLVAVEHFRKYFDSFAEVVLGFTGGFFGSPCTAEEEITHRQLCNYFALYAKVQAFLRYGPYYYGGRLREVFGNTYLTLASAGRVIGSSQIPESEKQFVIAPAAMPLPLLQKHLQDTSAGKTIVDNHPGLLALVNAVLKRGINLLPVYGKTFQEDERMYVEVGGDWIPASGFPANILQPLLAAAHAQKTLTRGMVVSVFYNFEKESAALSRIIHQQNWTGYDMPGMRNVQAMMTAMNMTARFATASLQDANAATMIRHLGPGQLLLLSMGKLPKLVFDSLFTTRFALTPFREGANSFNSLVATGRPHFRCAPFDSSYGWEVGYDFIQSPVFKEALKKLYDRFCAFGVWEIHSGIAEELGDLIVAAENPESLISQAFAHLGELAQHPENNRIEQGMRFAYMEWSLTMGSATHPPGLEEQSAASCGASFPAPFVADALTMPSAEQVLLGARQGMMLGVVHGGAHVLESALVLRGTSWWLAKGIGKTAGYAGYFVTQFSTRYLQAPAEEEATFMDHLCAAAIDTVQVCAASAVIEGVSALFGKLADVCASASVAEGLKKAGSVARCGLFAVASVAYGGWTTVAAIASGIVTEKVMTSRFGR